MENLRRSPWLPVKDTFRPQPRERLGGHGALTLPPPRDASRFASRASCPRLRTSPCHPRQAESHRRPAGTRTGDRRQPSAELLPPPGPLGARCRRALGPRTRALPRALRLPPHRTRPPCCGRGSSARPGLARPPQATRRARQAPGLTGRCLFKRSDVSAAQPWQRPVTLAGSMREGEELLPPRPSAMEAAAR